MPRTLLPPGCYDLLPPHAEAEQRAVTCLLETFARFGYAQVSPPLLEYTESMLSGRGAEFSRQVFRVMDPEAQKVMGIRADITLQVARIASERMKNTPRPLRLSYSGPILRAQGELLREKRQFTQAGIELIGVEAPAADAEVIMVGIAALKRLQVPSLTVDLNMPGLVETLLGTEAVNTETRSALLHNIAQKDITSLKHSNLSCTNALIGLLNAAGPADEALQKIKALHLPAQIQPLLAYMEELLALLAPIAATGVTFTLDPLERQGFEYHSHVSFSFFAQDATHELGRGGHYYIDGEEAGESATGFTLYVDSLRWLIPNQKQKKRVYLAEGIKGALISERLENDYILICDLPGEGTIYEKAVRFGCDFVYKNGHIEPVTK